jgi:L-2,4-diaminobutyrate decarboxylase
MLLRSSTQAAQDLAPASNASGAETAIFNDQQLAAWSQQTQEVLALMTRTVTGVEKPFSGILPHELAAEFSEVDLDRPLGAESALSA